MLLLQGSIFLLRFGLGLLDFGFRWKRGSPFLALANVLEMNEMEGGAMLGCRLLGVGLDQVGPGLVKPELAWLARFGPNFKRL